MFNENYYIVLEEDGVFAAATADDVILAFMWLMGLAPPTRRAMRVVDLYKTCTGRGCKAILRERALPEEK